MSSVNYLKVFPFGIFFLDYEACQSWDDGNEGGNTLVCC